MRNMLKEEDASLGFLCPEGAFVTAIPQCNVCVFWDGPGKCKKLGEAPEDIRKGKAHNCKLIIHDSKRFNYQRYAELYQEEVSHGKG